MKRLDDSTVSMHVDEYRFFITQVKTLEAENTALKDVLSKERASFDVLAVEVGQADKARLEEREAADKVIKDLEAEVASWKRRRFYPGIIGGVRPTGDWDVEGVIGLGWKIDVF